MPENNCETCNHKRHTDGGHCYMFREEPVILCMQHSDRRPQRGTIGHIGQGSTTLVSAIVAALGADFERPVGVKEDGNG